VDIVLGLVYAVATYVVIQAVGSRIQAANAAARTAQATPIVSPR